MASYWVVCDQQCPGYECSSYQEACGLLKEMLPHYPQAIIISPLGGDR